MFSRSLAVRYNAHKTFSVATKGSFPAALRTVAPAMQIYNVQEDPSQGSVSRFTAEARGIRLGVTPQLNAPNADPQDITPQFDAKRRAVSTFSPAETAGFLAVVEGKLPSFKVVSDYRDITFAAAEGKTKAFSFTGSLKRFDETELPLDLTFEKGTLASFRNFLESSIDEGFGFAQHFNQPITKVIAEHEAKQKALRRQQEKANNNNNNNNKNTNNNSKRNNNNNDNSNNSNNNNRNNNITNNNAKRNNENGNNNNNRRNRDNKNKSQNSDAQKPKVDETTAKANEKRAEQLATEDFI